jgi:hypothetical protein
VPTLVNVLLAKPPVATFAVNQMPKVFSLIYYRNVEWAAVVEDLDELEHGQPGGGARRPAPVQSYSSLQSGVACAP